MYKLEGTTIKVTRGDSCTISIRSKTLDDNNEQVPYIFKPGDCITFGIYNRKKLNESPILYKKIIVESDSEIIDFCLSSADTKLGEMLNKPSTYWYEIQLNNEKTLLGYDDNGAKLLIIYPEGDDLNE